jgi:hypothetical protein
MVLNESWSERGGAEDGAVPAVDGSDNQQPAVTLQHAFPP